MKQKHEEGLKLYKRGTVLELEKFDKTRHSSRGECKKKNTKKEKTR